MAGQIISHTGRTLPRPELGTERVDGPFARTCLAGVGMRRVWAAACVVGLLGCGGASGSKVRQLGGVLTVTPANLDFGDVALGKEATHRVTLHNDGIVPMTVTADTVFPDAAFEVVGLPVTLGVGQSAALSVRYRPPALGSHEQTLQLVTDAPGDMPVDLRGHAVRGLAQLSGDSFDFGDVVVNETAVQDLQLVNNDGHAETSVKIDPPANTNAFAVKPPGEQALSAEQSMIVTIQFQPDHLGDFASAVMVTPCPTCSPRRIALAGRGVDKLLLVRPESIDFGNVKLGAKVSQPFTVTNTSKSPVAITAFSLTGSGQLTAALDNAATFPMTLQPGQTATGTARFQPRTLGAQTAQASMAASDGGPGVLALSGLAMGPVLQATPRALFVGPAALGTTRNSAVTITNVGLDPQNNSPLLLSDVRIEGNDGSWAVRVETMNVGEPGSSTQAHIAFTPQTTGLSQATLVLESNDGLHPRVDVPLAATGRDLLPCTLEVQPAEPINFGLQKLFTPSVQGFELTNTTADDCIVGEPAIVSGGPQFRWPGGIVPAGRTLPPGHRMSVRVEFFAEQAQTYSGAVAFYVSNKAAPLKTVNLLAAGDSSCFFLSPATVDFGATIQSCAVPDQFVFAVNHCSFPVTVTAVETSGPPFSTSAAVPVRIAAQTHANLPIGYAPPSPGDDVGAVRVFTDMRAEPFQSGITGGSRSSSTVLDQWDQSTPKVDMLIVIDNSGSMQEEQQALAANLDHLWNRIALARADFHIAVTTTGMSPYTFKQCPGGADGGEAGRFFPVDNSRPRLLTPQTPDVRNVLFANTSVGTCHFDERFLDPVVAALTDPLISSTKAPGTPWPADGNAGFLRDDARLALLAVSDADDANDVINPAPVSDYVARLAQVKHGALDLISFAGIVPLHNCATVEGIGTRYMEIARQLGGHLEDICDLGNFGAMLDNSLGNLLLPLTSFQLSAHPRDPSAIVVTVDGAVVTSWSYDAASNRIVFPADAAPPPGSHITAKYEPACG
jgi:hypothetical protein